MEEVLMSIDRINRKRGAVWRARVLLPNGKRLSKCFERKVDAEHWEARVKADGLNSSELKRKQTRFEQLCDLYVQTSQSEQSPATYQKCESAIRLYIRPEFEGLWLEDISRLMIEGFKVKLLKTDLA